MIIVAYDLSLTATGFDTGDGQPLVIHTSRVGVERLWWYREQIRSAVDALRPDVAVIEDYAYNSHAAHSHQLGELGGVVRLTFYDLDVPLIAVPPASLKRWLTGKGNASKDAMVATAARLGCPADNNNAADAWALRQMALYAYGLPSLPATAYRDETVAKLTWPSLEAATMTDRADQRDPGPLTLAPLIGKDA